MKKRTYGLLMNFKLTDSPDCAGRLITKENIGPCLLDISVLTMNKDGKFIRYISAHGALRGAYGDYVENRENNEGAGKIRP